MLAVQGPRSAEVLAALGLPTEHDYMSFRRRLGRREVVVCRTGYTGEHGYELSCRSRRTPARCGTRCSRPARLGVRPCGLGARDTLRTEMGYPLHGQDLSLDITPVQARSGWAVGWEKPAFWGREALLAEKEAGPGRLLWGLEALDRGIPRPHMAVLPAATSIGEVTSGTFSPTRRMGIGLALPRPRPASARAPRSRSTSGAGRRRCAWSSRRSCRRTCGSARPLLAAAQSFSLSVDLCDPVSYGQGVHQTVKK